ncbi:MAG: WD40/YVTN/BNR-like repeat-containing protein [Gemmatimonadales bacterium]
MNSRVPLLVSMVACATCGASLRTVPFPETGTPVLAPQVSGTMQLLQAVSVVDEDVVWVSGHGGTFTRTTDGGTTWTAAVVPGGDTLQFRDVHAFSADNALLMGAGPGDMSRVYRTVNGGRDWELVWLNSEPAGFYDCFDFWDDRSGIMFGDAVDGELRIQRTDDGGRTWTRVGSDGVPPARPGEGSFAASGTCVQTMDDSLVWIGTGAGLASRVLKSTDRGNTWSVRGTPILRGEASTTSGIASVAFATESIGFVFGGELRNTEEHTANVARTDDGGHTWRLAEHPVFTGAICGSSLVPNTDRIVIVVVGPNGMDYSTDGAVTWRALDGENYWAVGFAGPSAGWAVGPEGRIVKIEF